MSAPTDRDLILRARRGDAKTDAFGELVMRYHVSVFNVCYRNLHERAEAEDLAQGSFMCACERLHTFDLECEFGPWL
ncbi:MAG TPA: sigma factor [Anaerolineales bacterium]|nr:sigma factor [Anaerolineales bacterium]